MQRSKLQQATFRLKERDKILFQTCTNALNSKNKQRAAICANELVEVRRLIKFLYNVELAIERVILRLETIRELSDIVVDLKPALRILQNVSQQLFEVLPDVSSELSKVNEAISDTLYSTKITADESIIPVGKQTVEGQEILEQVSTYLEQKLNNQLPEPPAILKTSEVPKNAVKEIVALAASCSEATGREETKESRGDSTQTLFSYKKAEIKEISLKVEQSSLEDMLLEYIRRSNGEVDIERCSVDLSASNQEIEKALENLGAKGKIKIELKCGE